MKWYKCNQDKTNNTTTGYDDTMDYNTRYNGYHDENGYDNILHNDRNGYEDTL